MKEHWLLFKPDMVQKTLKDLKIHTRRVGERYKSWKKGDRIYVRETYLFGTLKDLDYLVYGAVDVENDPCYDGVEFKKVSSIHMPKKHSRIWLELTADVWQQRIQDISAEDCFKEGAEDGQFMQYVPGMPDEVVGPCVIQNFSEIWDDINLDRGYGWKANPEVNVIEYRRIENG